MLNQTYSCMFGEAGAAGYTRKEGPQAISQVSCLYIVFKVQAKRLHQRGPKIQDRNLLLSIQSSSEQSTAGRVVLPDEVVHEPSFLHYSPPNPSELSSSSGAKHTYQNYISMLQPAGKGKDKMEDKGKFLFRGLLHHFCHFSAGQH